MQILDPSTNKFYIVVEQSVHQKAMEAMRIREEEDLAAIRRDCPKADLYAFRNA